MPGSDSQTLLGLSRAQQGRTALFVFTDAGARALYNPIVDNDGAAADIAGGSGASKKKAKTLRNPAYVQGDSATDTDTAKVDKAKADKRRQTKQRQTQQRQTP